MLQDQSTTITRVVAYAVSTDVEQQVKEILNIILDRHNCTDLFAPLYTCVKELIINAIKANYKNIYFENYESMNHSEETIAYETALKLFQLEITSESSRHLEDIARAEDIRVDIDFWTADGVLHVLVANPVMMTRTELENVNRKLADAEECGDLAQYFLKNADDPHREGAGLGLILIMMMLKSLEAPPNSLVISSGVARTTAYLRIPLSGEAQICA